MNFKNNRILIVDDNPSIHEDYQKIFSDRVNRSNPKLEKLSTAIFGEPEPALRDDLTFELDFAFQGKEALEKVVVSLEKKLPYSLIFMDVRMPPGWDGIETIKRIWDVDPRIQMVICTAYSDYSWLEILDSIEHSESLLILKKPFESMEVLQIAYSLTTRWGLARQAELKDEELEALVKIRTNELQEKSALLFEAEKMASIGILAGGIAHEFNNINAVILGFTDIALMNKKLETPFKEYFEKIKVAGLRGKTISKNLLTFAGKNSFEKKDVALNELVIHALVQMQSEISNEGIVVFKDFQKLPLISLDQGMINQVLLGVIKNALESMVDKSVKELRIKTFCDKDWVYISIEDTGAGIRPDKIKNIFDPFYSTKGPHSEGATLQSKFGGTGLGLSVGQAIVATHKGEIMVTSTEGAGSIFTIKLPNIQDTNPIAIK
jgi:signal transduction histidine kinase